MRDGNCATDGGRGVNLCRESFQFAWPYVGCFLFLVVEEGMGEGGEAGERREIVARGV